VQVVTVSSWLNFGIPAPREGGLRWGNFGFALLQPSRTLCVYGGECCERAVFASLWALFQLFWFSCQYLPSDWLERLVWGRPVVVRRLSPQSQGWRVRLCVFFILCVSTSPYTIYIFHALVRWYSLFVLKVPLNTNQQTFFSGGGGCIYLVVSVCSLTFTKIGRD